MKGYIVGLCLFWYARDYIFWRYFYHIVTVCFFAVVLSQLFFTDPLAISALIVR